MTQTLVSVALFVVLLAMVPLVIRWVQQRSVGGAAGAAASARVVSAVAVGPHQRVVTVEVGPQGARVWLTLGVTAQNISCLHTMAAGSGADLPASQVIENGSTP